MQNLAFDMAFESIFFDKVAVDYQDYKNQNKIRSINKFINSQPINLRIRQVFFSLYGSFSFSHLFENFLNSGFILFGLRFAEKIAFVLGRYHYDTFQLHFLFFISSFQNDLMKIKVDDLFIIRYDSFTKEKYFENICYDTF